MIESIVVEKGMQFQPSNKKMENPSISNPGNNKKISISQSSTAE